MNAPEGSSEGVWSGFGGPADADARTHLVVDIADLSDGGATRFALPPDTHHHCARVLRLRPNDRVTLTDGHGRWVLAVLAQSFADTGQVSFTSSVAICAEPPDLGVAFSLTKGDRPETVVQKLTELGIRRIIPIQSSRSVVKWDHERAERNSKRLALVARSALEQSRGVWLPIIEQPLTVGQLAVRPGAVRADRGGRPVRSGDLIVAIGPEGGWDAAEKVALPDAIGLPGSVLRAETAAIVAAALLVGAASRQLRDGAS